MDKKMTAQQVLKKYKGKWIECNRCPLWDTDKDGNTLYVVNKTYNSIKENTTLVVDENFYLNY